MSSACDKDLQSLNNLLLLQSTSSQLQTAGNEAKLVLKPPCVAPSLFFIKYCLSQTRPLFIAHFSSSAPRKLAVQKETRSIALFWKVS